MDGCTYERCGGTVYGLPANGPVGREIAGNTLNHLTYESLSLSNI